ncbi:MAG: hypothetical protein ACOWWM_20100 [Desulfobacterales bacterium]
MDSSVFLTLVKETAEKHGCRITDVDLENHVLNLDGPEDAMEACARALANLLE